MKRVTAFVVILGLLQVPSSAQETNAGSSGQADQQDAPGTFYRVFAVGLSVRWIPGVVTNISGIPAYMRTVPIHENDGAAGTPVVIPQQDLSRSVT
jgi:hypothetical protein